MLLLLRLLLLYFFLSCNVYVRLLFLGGFEWTWLAWLLLKLCGLMLRGLNLCCSVF